MFLDPDPGLSIPAPVVGSFPHDDHDRVGHDRARFVLLIAGLVFCLLFVMLLGIAMFVR